MTLQSSGPISIRDINIELGLDPSANTNLNSAIARGLAEKPSGIISLSDFYGKSDLPAFGAYLVGEQQAGTGSQIAFTASTPNEHPNRVLALCATHETARTISSVKVNGASLTRYETAGDNACVALYDFPEGDSASFEANFSGGLSNNAKLSVFELIGITRTGLTKDIENGLTSVFPNNSHFSSLGFTEGGMVLSLAFSNVINMGGNPQHAPIQLSAGNVNGNYSYRLGLYLPTTTEGPGNTFGTHNAAGTSSYVIVSLKPAA